MYVLWNKELKKTQKDLETRNGNSANVDDNKKEVNE